MKELMPMPMLPENGTEELEEQKRDLIYSKGGETDEFTKMNMEEEINKYNEINKDNIIIIKNSDYYKKCCIKLLKNKVFIAFFLSYFAYFLSLLPCNKGEDVCSTKKTWMEIKITEEIISAAIMTLMIQLMLFKKISKTHFIHIFLVFLIFYIFSHGYVFPDHGYFNLFYYCILVSLFTIILIPLDVVIYCIINNVKKIIIILYIVSFISIISFLYIYLIVISSNCDDWGQGLNNTSIENSELKNGCQIQIPQKCTYKILNGIQDYTKLNGKNCQNFRVKNEKKILLEQSKSLYVNENSKRIGYPLTNKCPVCSLDYLFNTDHPLREYFFKNLVDMDNKEILEKYYKDSMPEIVIDFSNDSKGDLKININFNKTLSEERKLLENKSSPFSENILMLYVDSVSRPNSFRKLKKTLKFFEKFMSYEGGFNEKYPTEKYHSFQFFKYYAFLEQTSGNWPIIFYGLKKGSQNKILMTKFFKEKGYVTSNANDFCDKENTRTYHNLTEEEIYDHQFINCDPNQAGISSVTMRCLYGKPDIEQFLDYTDQFWRKYSNNRKFSTVITNHGHEGSLNVVKYIDDSIFNFLNNLFNDNLLRDTTVFLISDHGVVLPSVYYLFDFFQLEKALPMLYILVNDRKNVSYEEQYMNMHENQQKFITGFDIYNTFGHLLFGKEYNSVKNKTKLENTFKSENGISLFNYINGKERNVEKYSQIASIYLHCCK